MSNSIKIAEEPVPENIRDQVFKQLKSVNKNNICIDCEKKNPKWASIHLGIQLCIDCAGKHRQYGVMFSFIKSTNLDVWNRKQLTYIQKGGNARALDYFRKCGVISDNQKHIDYKSPIVQKYKAILTSQVDSELSGVSPVTTQKQLQKKKVETMELTEQMGEIKRPKQIPTAEIVAKQQKGKKKNKKKGGTKINLQDFDTMEFDDGVPTEQKEKIIKAYENNSKNESSQTQYVNKQSTQITIVNQPVPIVEKSRQLNEQETKQKLQEMKTKTNVKSISSQEFKDNSVNQGEVQQKLNKFQGSSSISSSTLFGQKDAAQDDGSVTKIKDFVVDAGDVLYTKLSGLSSYWKKS